MQVLKNDQDRDFLKVIEEALGSDLHASTYQYGELTIQVDSASIVRVLTTLRNHPKCLFKLLLDICGVDYPGAPQRFRVVYHLLSVEQNRRLRVKLSTDEQTSVPSVTGVFSGANWFEREAYDMYGITFMDHPDLRRILTDYEFEGYPMRKDFPVSGYVEVRYDPSLQKVVYEPISLQQDFRDFDFLSPWEGLTTQPGEKETIAYTSENKRKE